MSGSCGRRDGTGVLAAVAEASRIARGRDGCGIERALVVNDLERSMNWPWRRAMLAAAGMTSAQSALIDAVRAHSGDKAVITDANDIAPWLTDWRGRFHGAAPAILAPDTAEGVQFAVGARA